MGKDQKNLEERYRKKKRNRPSVNICVHNIRIGQETVHREAAEGYHALDCLHFASVRELIWRQW